MKHTLITASFAALWAAPVQAADSPWVGTWKLDLSRSHVPEYRFSITKSEKGRELFRNHISPPYFKEWMIPSAAM